MAGGRVRRGGGGLLVWLVAALGAGAIFVGAFLMSAIDRPGPGARDAVFVVERGASGGQIGAALEREGLITDDLLFRIANRLYASGAPLQAGEYSIPAGASVREIVELMARGAAVQHALTFPEGITVASALRIIAEAEVLTGDMPEEPPPEGSLLPETYHVARGMARAALIQQMRDAHDRVLDEVWEGRDQSLPVTAPEQLVIIASIVERETGVARERPLVAAVVYNRLRRPMRLEMDSTIIYGVCRQFPDRCSDGRLVNAAGQRRTIRQSEIELNTGYNTYRIDGLPPTPIANPGRAALEAAANPAQSNAIFFVADGSGGHVFTATIAEHNAAVERWRVIESQRIAAERGN